MMETFFSGNIRKKKYKWTKNKLKKIRRTLQSMEPLSKMVNIGNFFSEYFTYNYFLFSVLYYTHN